LPETTAFQAVAVQFPTVRREAERPVRAEEPPRLTVALADWESPAWRRQKLDTGLDGLDEASRGGPFVIDLLGDREPQASTALEVLTRSQRLLGRRNAESRKPRFDRLLLRHRAMHDLTRPRDRAAYRHANDTWQWLLRLDPAAEIDLQIAALLHDVERLRSAPGPGPGPGSGPGSDIAALVCSAHDDQISQDEHAREGAWMADEMLADLEFGLASRVRVAQLIRHHERPPSGVPAMGPVLAARLALLIDADALSTISLESEAELEISGPDGMRRRTAAVLSRMRPETRRCLGQVRLHPEVRRAVRELMQLEESAWPAAPSRDAARPLALGATDPLRSEDPRASLRDRVGAL
jgi:hypothetical protein